MMNRKKYAFYTYSGRYRGLFAQERRKIQKIIPRARIAHIGSTAVPGLGGKGIIDLIVAVPRKDIDKTITLLRAYRYDYRPFGGDKDRKFFQKIIRYAGKERRVHIQLTCHDSRTWKSSNAVRNYLIHHPESLKEYEKVKKAAVRYAKGEGKKYRRYKDSFLKKIEKVALKENAS